MCGITPYLYYSQWHGVSGEIFENYYNKIQLDVYTVRVKNPTCTHEDTAAGTCILLSVHIRTGWRIKNGCNSINHDFFVIKKTCFMNVNLVFNTKSAQSF